jgi:5-dehydro-4-deoxyglucarate dehydratase
LLSFPITDFDAAGKFNAKTYKTRIAWFLEHDISSIFIAGGTGEFFSIDEEEYEAIVKVAVETVKGEVPVISSTGKSVREGIRMAAIAEKAGVDALLLFPPYLTECPQDGVVEYARQIISSTSLPVIYYNRANGTLNASNIEKLAAACPNLIGLKDGTGNIQELNDTIRTVGNRLTYIGGVPTAEIMAEAYLSIGVNTYSSAAFNFVPELANKFYKALRLGNKSVLEQITKDFYIPLVRMRGRKNGYAVSLIKAGAEIIGKSAGAVRPPLSMPTAAEYEELKELIAKNTND